MNETMICIYFIIAGVAFVIGIIALIFAWIARNTAERVWSDILKMRFEILSEKVLRKARNE